MLQDFAVEGRRDDGEDSGDDERDAEPQLQGKEIQREEGGSNELRVRAILAGDDHRVTVTAQEIRLLVVGERPAERLLAVFDLRQEILGQLANDVVLIPPGQKESNGLQIPVEQLHGRTP